MHERPNNKIFAANTSELEMEIDLLVYHFYRLSFEEAKVIDNSLMEEEFGKEEVR